MIIDCILSRYEESRKNGSYYPERFRDSVENYINIFPNAVDIVYAMDKGSEQEVKASLITYLIDNKYNPRIIDYVLSVDWLNNIPKEEPSVIDLDAKPANEQEYQEQIKRYKQLVNNITLHEKKLKIFDTYYERIIKGRYFTDCPIRYSVIEYLCSFPKINPVYMARRLANSGYEIAFDDTSITQSENNKKRREVFDFEYRKRVGLGAAIPMFLEEPTFEQEKNNIEDDYERED